MQVRVRTGDVRGAGTDADVSIILMGSKAQSEEIQLESSADNFERNKVRCANLHIVQAGYYILKGGTLS